MDLPHLLGAIASGALATVGIRGATEEPRYEVVGRIGEVEVRRYAPRIAAETVVTIQDEEKARNEGFRRVARYIFGGNASEAQVAMTAPVVQAAAGQQIAMTAPVVQSPSAGGWRIQFLMPASYTMETLPKPLDGTVRLVPVPARTYAVIRFTGSRSPQAMQAQQARLRAAVAQTEWVVTGGAENWMYDPPWTVPFTRRNEVALPVGR